MLRRLLIGGTTAALTTTGLVLAGPATAAHAGHGGLPDGRRVVEHVVRRGDTATSLAVRYHAWTAELIEHNHLGPDATLRVGDRIEVPVVVSAVRRADAEPRADRRRPAGKWADRARERAADRRTPPATGRDRVRRTIAAAARRHGVDPDLALAMAWQESGWQMDVVSTAGAIGAMQVLPTTGTWMELYADRSLRLRRLRDNVEAGVRLLRVLDDHTSSRRRQVAAYYQGLGAVREHGLYDETEAYVANVLAIKRRLEQGRPPS
jgi:murein DD-endopeptidase MepM/ murein hydrolase activator NlpD